MKEATTGHDVAGRLFRLPHVAARLDEVLITIAQKAELVYSPLVDAREYPHDVDVAIVEGAVSSEEDLEKIRRSASARASWWRSATAPSPPTSRACAIRSR